MLIASLLALTLAAQPASAEKLRSTAEKAARLKALQGEAVSAAAAIEPLAARLKGLTARLEVEGAAPSWDEHKAVQGEALAALRRMRELDSEFAGVRHSYELDRGIVMAAELLSQGSIPGRQLDMSDAAALDAFQESMRRPQEELERVRIIESQAFSLAVKRQKARRRHRRLLAGLGAVGAAALGAALLAYRAAGT